MLTIKAEIKKSEQRSDKTYNVKLRFILGRKVKRVSTSLFVAPKDLTKDFKIKQNSPIKKDVDALIRAYQEKCAKFQIELNDYTVDDIVDMLNGEQAKSQKIDFIMFCREWIANAEIKGAPNYTTAVNALVRFVGKEELDIKLIIAEFLERFKEFLNKEREERAKRLALQGKRLPSNRAQSLYLMSIKKLFKEAKKFRSPKIRMSHKRSRSPAALGPASM